MIAGGAWYYYRGRHMGSFAQAVGTKPAIPEAKPQGAMPMLKMPTAMGWAPGKVPTVKSGLKVTPFALNLKHPRWAYVLPNGDVLIAESASLPGTVKNVRDYAMNRVMSRAGATRPSANQITLLRDADGDGVPEVREVFMSGLSQPFGMALVGSTLYIGNTDSVMAFPYEAGQTKITAPGRKLMSMKPGGHWTRNIIASKDGTKLYVAVGSQSNIAESGFEVEEGRACIFELDLKTEQHRIFAGGLRNPVGMAWEPTDGKLWTVVNERDGLGDETPPDYLTSVKDGGFYGWPYSYWGQTVDDRVPQDAALVAKASAPDYALGGHTASLGLCWLPESTLPGLPSGMVIGQHGSWNRSKLSGYRVVLVPFNNGKPQGAPIDLLTGFLADDEKTSNGRPVGVVVAKDGALLAVDDVGDAVWRVSAA
ncbi:PQQ-dependent sugar dehydrogenase [Devosia sp. SL43]|uniref:PQQ-dependent sugar dehydrogenase n=1 Tax=Devosia sp. SL43 TaxID=2806348 RepID=UPI001F1D2BCD|nr:sorbosone dehydrogenase family protein [Devosia sp. SL43]